MLSRPTWRAAALLAVAIGAVWYAGGQQDGGPPGARLDAVAAQPAVADAARAAFEGRVRGQVITATGRVERILADDRDGSPHQRFIMRSAGGISLLVAHNLDLAPRLEGLAPGDIVVVLGEYEWNAQGGVMHWTHDDPQGRHRPGYIEWRGRRYH